MRTKSSFRRTARYASLLLLCLALPAALQAGDYTYITNETGTITITGYTGPGGDVTIPDTITDLPVTTFSDNAFSHRTNLTSVTLPKSVTSIGAWVLGVCSSLTAINVQPANPAYSSLDGVLFTKNHDTLVEYPAGRAGGYTVPASVTNIGNIAFEACVNLSSVAIPDSVAIIGSSAFVYCTGLTNLIIGTNVTTIGPEAFRTCSSLTTVTIPDKVIAIGDRTFSFCGSLTNVIVGNSVTRIETMHSFSAPAWPVLRSATMSPASETTPSASAKPWPVSPYPTGLRALETTPSRSVSV